MASGRGHSALLKSKSRVDIVAENLGDVFLVERLGSGGYERPASEAS